MYVLGADIGTTGTKALLVNASGERAGAAYRPYPLIVDAGGLAEQRAADWWHSLVDVIRTATADVKHKEAIRAICLSAQGGSCVLLGDDGEALANAHTWMDRRPESVLDAFAGIDGRYIYETTGWPLSGAMMAARAVWFRRNQPKLWARVQHYLTTADYLHRRLTGRASLDLTNAAMTQLFNIRAMRWDPALLSAAGVPLSMLPDIVRSGDVAGLLTAEAAGELGLAEGTPVISGAHDQYAAALGAGVCAPGDVLLSAGTAWVLLGVTDNPAYDNESGFCVGNHALPGLYGALSSLPAAGAALEWCRSNFFSAGEPTDMPDKVAYDKLNRTAQTRIFKDAGLFFYPQFGGRIYPRRSLKAKGSFMGLSLEHDHYDMALAIMEGVVFEAAMMMEAYAAGGFPLKQLSLAGGAGKSRLWTDILRHTTGLPLTCYRDADTACAGAAALAAVSCGMFPSAHDAVSAINANSTERLDAAEGALREHYIRKYERYKAGLPHIETFFAE
jgi:sugar (pentulose or hexulose) kinase